MDSENWSDILHTLRKRLPQKYRQEPLCLFSFAIAGVQDFLIQARTTRDVWAGSYLLSWLSWKAVESVCKRVAVERNRESIREALHSAILPNLDFQPMAQWAYADSRNSSARIQIAAMPNTALFVIPGDVAQAKQTGEATIRAVREEWDAIATGAFEPLSGTLRKAPYAQQQWFYQSRADRIFECYWSAIELPEGVDTFRKRLEGWDITAEDNLYSAAVNLSAALLASRKMTRDFQQVGEEGHRCGLCGSRAALADYMLQERDQRHQGSRGIWSTVVDSNGVRRFWDWASAADLGFPDEEYLCSVCAVRRLAPRYTFEKELQVQPDFPSTSGFAASSFLHSLYERCRPISGAAEVIQDFLSTVREFHQNVRRTCKRSLRISGHPLPWSGQIESEPWRSLFSTEAQWLYADSWDAESIANDLGDLSTVSIIRAQTPVVHPVHRMLSRLEHLLQNNGHTDIHLAGPTNHFVVLAADGDEMGRWISGSHSYFRVGNGLDFDPEFQFRLSGCLATFASKVRDIVEDRMLGSVVYAGADDLLAFLPASRALPAALAVRECFRDYVSSPMKCPMTISIACVAGRRSDPLSGLIRSARMHLTETAKLDFGRNALVLARTTGARTATGVSFEGPAVANLMDLQSAFQHSELSPRVIYPLADLAESLSNWEHGTSQQEAQRTMIVQCLAQRQDPDSEKSLKPLLQLYDGVEQWIMSERGRNKPTDPFSLLVDLVRFAHFLVHDEKE